VGTGPGLWHSTPLFNMKFRPKKLHDLPKRAAPSSVVYHVQDLRRSGENVTNSSARFFCWWSAASCRNQKTRFLRRQDHICHIRIIYENPGATFFFDSQFFFFLRDSVKPQKVWCMCSFGTTLPGKSSGKSKEHMLGSKWQCVFLALKNVLWFENMSDIHRNYIECIMEDSPYIWLVKLVNVGKCCYTWNIWELEIMPHLGMNIV